MVNSIWLDGTKVTDPSPFFNAYDRIVVHWYGFRNYTGSLEVLERYKMDVENHIDRPSLKSRLQQRATELEASDKGDEVKALQSRLSLIPREIEALREPLAGETGGHAEMRKTMIIEKQKELTATQSQLEQAAGEFALIEYRLD